MLDTDWVPATTPTYAATVPPLTRVSWYGPGGSTRSVPAVVPTARVPVVSIYFASQVQVSVPP